MNTTTDTPASISHSHEPEAPTPYRVFWQPGCSSCVKVKEFLSGLGVPFESMNVAEDQSAMDALIALGLRSVPVVTHGQNYVHAQSLKDVATFVGRQADATPKLSSPELMASWQRVLDASQRMVASLPTDRLSENIVPGRKRSMRDVAYHIFQIPDGFLRTVEDGLEDWRLVTNVDPPEDVKSVVDIQNYASAQTTALRRWWQGVEDRECRWLVPMYYGTHSVHSFLERSTWHSAQHARQLTAVLQGYGVVVDDPLRPQDYDGLPMPAGLWE